MKKEIANKAELALRALSLGILAWMLWLSLDRGVAEQTGSAGSGNLMVALKDWTLSGSPPRRVSVQLDRVPSARERDWLAALSAGGTEVNWTGELPVVGIDVHPVASPSGGLSVLVAAPSRSRAILRDEVGALDTVDARNGGSRIAVPAASGVVAATVAGTTARAEQRDSLQLRRVLIIGGAGWESKFVTTALEEAGWMVDAQIVVAPGVTVSQGSPGQIDTARYSAVVALDETAAPSASRIFTYVSNGGGLILAPSASSSPALAPLRIGAAGRSTAVASLAGAQGPTTLETLALSPITGWRSDAVVLGRRGQTATVAARRLGVGRVLQHGYEDTWRWRMSGSENSVAEHRAWWTTALSVVAYAPRRSLPDRADLDAAPLARLIESLGPASAPLAAGLSSVAVTVSLWWLFALLAASLLAEWASRRLRGAR
ncbi:MAG: hypothetical protein H0U59_01615 [Gemmatimonadaceae bacterium]|nr:hypothetical protein [Gemmatimonadaceae bacterium]